MLTVCGGDFADTYRRRLEWELKVNEIVHCDIITEWEIYLPPLGTLLLCEIKGLRVIPYLW